MVGEITTLVHDIVDIELLLIRGRQSAGVRLQTMLDTRELLLGLKRGSLRGRYPKLTDEEINLKVFEEIDRARNIRSRP